MKPRNMFLMLLMAFLLLPVVTHAQGNDWSFHASPLKFDDVEYSESVLLVTGWSPPNEISTSESVGWDEVDGEATFDVIVAEVDGYLTTIYATHGLYETLADFEYHFTSVPGLGADDIDPVEMYDNAVVHDENGLDFEADGGLLGAGFVQIGTYGYPSITFYGGDTGYNPNYRYWQLGYTPVWYDNKEYRLSWFVPDFGAGSLHFGRPLTMDLDAVDPDLDLHVALVDLCQEANCDNPQAEHFRTVIWWPGSLFDDSGDLETMLALNLPSEFDDYEVEFFSTDVVLEAPNAYDDFTFTDWPSGLTGADPDLYWLGQEAEIHVFDADSEADIEDADWCWLMNPNSGEILDPYVGAEEMGDGIYRFVLPELPLRPGDSESRFAVACYKEDYLLSFMYQLVAQSQTPMEFPLMPVDVFTDMLVEELEYTSLEEDTGFIFGFAFWDGPYGWEPVGCAEASATGVDPDDIHYTDSTVGMPTLAQPSTDPADPSFLMVNVPVTSTGTTVELETTSRSTQETVPAVFEMGITFSFILFDGPTNPDGCE